MTFVEVYMLIGVIVLVFSLGSCIGAYYDEPVLSKSRKIIGWVVVLSPVWPVLAVFGLLHVFKIVIACIKGE